MSGLATRSCSALEQRGTAQRAEIAFLSIDSPRGAAQRRQRRRSGPTQVRAACERRRGRCRREGGVRDAKKKGHHTLRAHPTKLEVLSMAQVEARDGLQRVQWSVVFVGISIGLARSARRVRVRVVGRSSSRQEEAGSCWWAYRCRHRTGVSCTPRIVTCLTIRV